MVVVMLAGALMLFIGWIWLLVKAFPESTLWAILIFLFSPVGLVYGFMRFDELKIPTILYGSGLLLYIVGNVAA